ncbi:MAG: hypothetical protein LBQ24_02580 [Candidatus Peribacteria bacterium]|nr:hypothetical protein [Candidatus Peribacteria bacterium]
MSEDFSFENFYSIYPKKVNKKKAKQRFQKISFQILPVVFKKLKAYCEKRKKEATELQYIP